MLFAIHFFENKTPLLSQCLERIPQVNEDLKIKGRKGKVANVTEIEENKYHIHVVFEKIIKKETLRKDDKKKRR